MDVSLPFLGGVSSVTSTILLAGMDPGCWSEGQFGSRLFPGSSVEPGARCSTGSGVSVTSLVSIVFNRLAVGDFSLEARFRPLGLALALSASPCSRHTSRGDRHCWSDPGFVVSSSQSSTRGGGVRACGVEADVPTSIGLVPGSSRISGASLVGFGDEGALWELEELPNRIRAISSSIPSNDPFSLKPNPGKPERYSEVAD